MLPQRKSILIPNRSGFLVQEVLETRHPLSILSVFSIVCVKLWVYYTLPHSPLSFPLKLKTNFIICIGLLPIFLKSSFLFRLDFCSPFALYSDFLVEDLVCFGFYFKISRSINVLKYISRVKLETWEGKLMCREFNEILAGKYKGTVNNIEKYKCLFVRGSLWYRFPGKWTLKWRPAFGGFY